MNTQDRSGRRTAAVGGVLACVLVFMLVSASKWTVPVSDGTEATGAASGASAAASTASALAPADARAPLAVAQTASSGASGAASAADALSPRARRMRDDWCGFGMAEALREAEALEARNEAARKAGRPEEDAGESEAAQVLSQAREERQRAWIQTLRSRRDLRSHAVAELLVDDPPSRARLQDLARRSTDPMVTALAMMRPCKAPACRAIDPAQWSRLEPDNLMAWVAQIQGDTVPPEQLSYLIERMGRDARRSDDYLGALHQMLAALVVSEPGLPQMAETELLASAWATFPVPNVRQVLMACSPAEMVPALHSSCERIADLLWDMPHQLGKALSMGMARRFVPPGHPRRSEWEQRALHFDAAAEALMADNLASMERWASKLPAQGCQAASEFHAGLRQTLLTPEWTRAEQALAASPDSREALVERARAKRGGRSPLDPVPTQAAPASASGR